MTIIWPRSLSYWETSRRIGNGAGDTAKTSLTIEVRSHDHLISLLMSLHILSEKSVDSEKNSFLVIGGLRRVAKLRPWGLKAVLTQKYDYPQEQAVKLRDFMLPMLALDPNDRPSAAELAKHPWLSDPGAAPPYAADRVSTTDDFYQVDDARLMEVLQALQAVSIQSESHLAPGIAAAA